MAAPLIDPLASKRSGYIPTGYIPTLDGWRAIAIVLIFIHHAPWSPTGAITQRIQANSALGVDLFFAISGVLICSRLLDEEKANGFFNLTGFYVRRAFRIFPPAYLYLGVVAILYATHFIPAGWAAWRSAMGFARNYFGAFFPDHFNNLATAHFWSLAVEEHFYLILPACLIVFRRHRLTALSLLTGAALLRLVFFVATTPALQRAIQWQHRTDLRITSLLFPALLALLLRLPRFRSWCQRFITPHTIVGLILLLFCVGLVKHFTHTPEPSILPIMDPASPGNLLPQPEANLNSFDVFVVPFFLPFLLLATVLHPATVVGRILELAPLRAIGRISYSLYLWQQLFWIAGDYTGFAIKPFHTAWIALPLTMVCALTSYYCVERPGIRMGHRLTRHLLSRKAQRTSSDADLLTRPEPAG